METADMKPSELLKHYLELGLKVEEGRNARLEMDQIIASVGEVLERFEGKVIHLFVDYSTRPYLVSGGKITPYIEPQSVYADQLDKPYISKHRRPYLRDYLDKEASLSGHHEPKSVSVAEIEAEVA